VTAVATVATDGKPRGSSRGGVFYTALRLLAFRITREELEALDCRHLIFGLLATWIVGMGRWWDDPAARPLQMLGVGSVLYAVFLSALIWLVLWPLRPRCWSYPNVLTFISLTSLPGAVYALPVEAWYDVETASLINLASLAVVALWRVSLLLFYLRRLGELSRWSAFLGASCRST
jgi:hypothetical protein